MTYSGTSTRGHHQVTQPASDERPNWRGRIRPGEGVITVSTPNNSYLKDLILLRNDPSKVARIREAAERGEVDAQYAMGLIYAEGRGVEIDLAQAHFWLSLAIAQGDRDADLLRNIIGSQMTDAEFESAKALAIAHRATHEASSTRH
jgi:TPR repeat protein